MDSANMVTPEQQSRVKTNLMGLIITLFALIRLAADKPLVSLRVADF